MAGIFHAHLRAMENTHTDVRVWKVKNDDCDTCKYNLSLFVFRGLQY